MNESRSSAFISYSREDSEFALRLAQDLKAAGAEAWIDQIDIVPGSSWDNAIEEALEAAQYMVLVLSPASARSENVRDEVSYALEQGKIVIPVLYVDCVVPLRLQRKQRIDLRANYAGGLAALLDHLRVSRPNPEVLEKVAEADARRHAAWQAREADAHRLAELKEQRKAEEQEPGGKTVEENVNQIEPTDCPKPRRSWRLGAIAAGILLLVTTVFAGIHFFRRPLSTPAPAATSNPNSGVTPNPSPVVTPGSTPGKSAPAAQPNGQANPAPAAKSVSSRQQTHQDSSGSENQQSSLQGSQAPGTWTDPETGLMWTQEDNGNGVTWQQAASYCKSLALGGYHDWRLPEIDELAGLYDPSITVNAVGELHGYQMHVRGNIELSGLPWSSTAGKAAGEAMAFGFIHGTQDSYKYGDIAGSRALCVRRSGK